MYTFSAVSAFVFPTWIYSSVITVKKKKHVMLITYIICDMKHAFLVMR